ncbi:MAG: SDR family NAD(P)-dependent oxidoreductase [Mangrovibacterium sp.]
MKVLITGGTNGMGKGVAKVLADIDNQAHEIIILCRSKELGEAAVKELIDATSNKKISIILCDLTKLADVKRAIIEIHEKHEFLDGIFINAGLGYATKRIETEDGFDSHFQVNYLSQFMLILNLLDLLKKSGKFITWQKNQFIDIKEDLTVLNREMHDKLWKISLELCADERTNQIANNP